MQGVHEFAVGVDSVFLQPRDGMQQIGVADNNLAVVRSLLAPGSWGVLAERFEL